jgi:hypothetical protein
VDITPRQPGCGTRELGPQLTAFRYRA